MFVDRVMIPSPALVPGARTCCEEAMAPTAASVQFVVEEGAPLEVEEGAPFVVGVLPTPLDVGVGAPFAVGVLPTPLDVGVGAPFAVGVLPTPLDVGVGAPYAVEVPTPLDVGAAHLLSPLHPVSYRHPPDLRGVDVSQCLRSLLDDDNEREDDWLSRSPAPSARARERKEVRRLKALLCGPPTRRACEVCGRTFASRCGLSRHKREIHDPTFIKFTCGETGCDASFLRKHKLEKHMHQHHELM